MKKTTFFVLFTALIFISTTAFIATSKHAAGFAGFTNSPSEGNCGSCHGGGSASASGITITATPAFLNNNYIAGTTYTINIDMQAVGFTKYGFGSEILNLSNTNAGTMQNPGAGVKFLTAGSGRKNAVQTTTKTGPGSATFSFEWVAPLSGNATIYVAANAVNGTGGTGGDFIFNSTLALTESLGVGIKENNSQLISQVSVYPNPAKDFTTVSYFLNTAQKINIQIIDLSGNLIKEIINENQSSAFQSKIINLQGIVSGVYFIKTTANDQKVSQKLFSVQ